ncbi:ribokinase [Lachnoanaerobaculum saburreum]|uniref:Ribokinase n=1 Tax=Lachnoanaerobaculum saburreum DSM 3986 TaxID=887325 RepID=E6LKN3_9FIRM|nr:ribokinase [Lachnoanaerobaculum saburreum]EFU77562.1 putative ribokinase [Lachnoanaerobaculum saburreum DSM 3986]
MKVLNFGSLNLDYVYDVDHFVREGETLSSTDMNVFCGGKGLNQSVALAKAGVKVYHAGAVGSADGEMLTDALSSVGVDISYIRRYDMPSGHAIIQKNKSGNNCILLYGGANQNIDKEFIKDVLKDFDKGDILLLQNEISNLSFIVDEAFAKGIRIVLNPSPINESIFECDLKKISYLILNEIEAADILSVEYKSKDDLIEKLTKSFPDTGLVLTLGEEGSVYVDKNCKIYQGIYPTKVVDTTAAGDTFTGYFIAGLVEGMDIKSALRQASKAASITVSKKGASPSIPFVKEVFTVDD